jgi:hypothetical protein
MSVPLILLFLVADIGIKKAGVSNRNRLLIALVFQTLLTVGIAWASYDLPAGLTPLGYLALGATASLFSMALVLLRWRKANVQKNDADHDMQSSMANKDIVAEGFDADPLKTADGEAGSSSAEPVSVQSDPLDAGEHLRLTAFTVLFPLLSSIAFYIGIIPVILLAYGYFMMRRTGDFMHIDVTVKYAKFFYDILFVLSIVGVFFILFLWLFGYVSWDLALLPVLLAAYFYGCLAAIMSWYYKPLGRHTDWVTVNGAFSRKQKGDEVPVASEASGTIAKRENLKQPSVADELAKWAKLRDDGVVSESEFEHARSQLLNEM